jgi:phytoene/squalene synthetase
MTDPRVAHPWIALLHERLDALERALLQGDAPGAEQASGAVQAALQQAPRTMELKDGHARDLHAAAQRFAQLRAATLRAAALNERALGSLLPDHLQKPTYQGLGKPGARRYAGA